MSWAKVSLLVSAILAALLCSVVFAPQGYTFHCLGAAWAASLALVCVLPLDRRP